MLTTTAAPRFLRRIDVQRATGLGESTIFKYVAAGTFPKPIKLTSNKNAWLESEVLAWMAERIAERDEATA
jgi:prophage regulatory protein